jgi:hypothetical protein
MGDRFDLIMSPMRIANLSMGRMQLKIEMNPKIAKTNIIIRFLCVLSVLYRNDIVTEADAR